MAGMVKMQEKHDQNNVAKEISAGNVQQFNKLFFRHLKASCSKAEETDWAVW